MMMRTTCGAPPFKVSQSMMTLTIVAKLSVATADFWVKYIELASTIVGKTKLKAWTSKEYECRNAIYSCLIPKNSVIGIDVEDIIKACLNLYGIKNSQGVVRCHTSHTMRDYQCICILEVTEQLAGIFEYHGQVLSGHFGPADLPSEVM